MHVYIYIVDSHVVWLAVWARSNTGLCVHGLQYTKQKHPHWPDLGQLRCQLLPPRRPCWQAPHAPMPATLFFQAPLQVTPGPKPLCGQQADLEQHAHLHAHIHTYTYIYIQICIYIYVYICISYVRGDKLHIYIHNYIYIYICIRV